MANASSLTFSAERAPGVYGADRNWRGVRTMHASRKEGKSTPDRNLSIYFTNVKQCDKAGRGGKEDPCSECRHFGGPNCQCVLVKAQSYNDMLWKEMMKRRNAGYTLPAEADRKAAKAPTKDKPNPPVPSPMPANKVKLDWQGESETTLLESKPFIPAYVRALPRAYLVPPENLSSQEKKSQMWHAQEAKRKRDEQEQAGNTPASAPTATTQSGAVVQIPEAPFIPGQGPVKRYTLLPADKEVEYEYQNGAKLRVPLQSETALQVRYPTPPTEVLSLIE